MIKRIIAFIFIVTCSYSIQVEASDLAGIAPEPKVLLNSTLQNDITYGSESAPVAIVEYASLSCSHCKYFHDDVFKPLKKNYIDSGKVKFVFAIFH